MGDAIADVDSDVAEVLAAIEAVPTPTEIVAALEAGGTKLTALHATLSASGVFASAAFANLSTFVAGDRAKLDALHATLSASGVLAAGAFANLPVPATAATLAKQTEILTAVLALALDGGSGAHLVTFDVVGPDNEPVDGVLVTLRKSGSPAERYTQITVGGRVSFALDTADWLRTFYKPGLSVAPDTLTVAGDLPAEGDEPEVVAMAATSSSPPSEPGKVTSRIRLVGGIGSATIRLVCPPPGSGLGTHSGPIKKTADPDRIAWFPNTLPGAEYEIRLGSSSSWWPTKFTIPADQVGDFDINNAAGILETPDP
jgi:hypothetical protein